MRFGIAAYPKDYAPAARAGFDYVELPCRFVAAMEDDAFGRFAKTVEAGPIPALAMNMYCPADVVIAGPGFDLPTAKTYAKRAAERAAALGVKYVGIGSPLSRTLPPGFSSAEADEQAASFLSATADIFGAAGITVCFEALAGVYCNYSNTLAGAVALARRVKHPCLRVVLDFYNMEHEGEAEMEPAPFMDMVVHAHLSDDEGGDPRQRSYLRADKAESHMRRIRRLAAAGYDGGVSLEIDLPVDVARGAESLCIMRRAQA